MKKNTKVFVAVAAVLLVIGTIAGIVLYRKFSPSKEHMKLTEYYKMGKNDVRVILEDEVLEVDALYQDRQVYLDYEMVKEKLNSRFYWDKNENLLLYSTPTAVISAEPGSMECYQNNSKSSKDYEIVRVDGEKVYVALDYVKEHTALEYKVYNEPTRIVINNVFGEETDYIKTDSDCALRYQADIKSDILVDLKENAKLRVIEKENKDTGFYKVMDKSGVTGFVRSKDLNQAYQEVKKTDFKEEKYSHILKDEKINLIWHQVMNQTANSGLLTVLSGTKGVNVICPTWFATSDNEGNIDSLASDTYVVQAHREGVEVWGLCNDFSPNMKIGKVLEKTSRRQKLAKNLVAEAIRYSLDGINIDFENVKKESGEDFIQFIRELGIMCRNNGIVLSIDNYPLRDYNEYYNRREQANVADYVITMAYDEYYAGSEEAGPVSSISYVKDSTEKILEQVPKKQAVIALPFYSRLWKEKAGDGEDSLSSEACSMAYAQEILQNSSEKAVWDDKTEMNYLEYKEGKTVHKIWIEDINSLKVKMEEVSKHKVAGVAFWKAGLEDSSVWDMVQKYNK
ncbi:glycosyl hydrolase family 18 [bacterium D16-51]|nr:glycosyl hydrolase family 18 [bacterium D16-59]RKI61456.1 glycosyl hydrolase family 18 [bacterium D16-51]